MGMSASQARYISLTARKNDTEYEAQQVNQQRLTLTNKMNEVYEALVNMEVPTPPSKIDFLIENYTGKIGGTELSVRQNESGKHIAYETVEGLITKKISGKKTTDNNEEAASEESVKEGDAGEQPDVSKSRRVENYLGKKGTVGEIPQDNRSENLEQAFQALKHSNSYSSDAELLEEYMLVTYDGEDESYAFVLRTDFDEKSSAISIPIFEVKTGAYEQEYSDGDYKIDFTTEGRVKSLTSGGKTTLLQSENIYDEIRYADAEAQYKYDKSVYDKEQNELNKKTALFQKQDKQLELKLTRLDTERNSLNTELDAVKKVIQDSVEKGFKTFSG